MKTQHTPGPWKVTGNIGRKSEFGIVADAAPCIIAIMGNQKEWPVEAQANAALIAVAPELLHEAENVIQGFGGDVPKWLQPNIDALQAVIDKAKG